MKINKYLLLIFTTVALYSCKKDFLDKEPSQYISADQLQRASQFDPALLNGNISGLYTTMYVTGSGGTDLQHDDFGQKSWDIYMDMLASDMVLGATNYGWYSTVARYQVATNYAANEAYMPWRYYYRIIFGANTVIDALGGTTAVPEQTVEKHTMGQAKAMRAYAYFYLSQLYARGYNETEKILPIYVDTKVPNQPKSTAKEVYDLMVSDLTEAIDYLSDFNRVSKDQVDQWVAKGLLAYVLAARGSQADLQQVVSVTNDIINNGGFSITNRAQTVANIDATSGRVTNPESGFNNIATPSWMWGVDLTLASDLDLVSWWGQVDVFTYSYAWAGDPKTIDSSLYVVIPAEDIRKNQFFEYYGDGVLYPANKFFDPGRREGGQRNVTTDYLYMRVDEMYFLNAEANARLGQDAAARTAVKAILTERLPDVSYIDGLSGQALKDEIYLQSRIEFWGEGKTYLALKRNKRSVTRGSNHLFEDGKTFSWDGVEMTLPIPQSEVLNNPFLNN